MAKKKAHKPAAAPGDYRIHDERARPVPFTKPDPKRPFVLLRGREIVSRHKSHDAALRAVRTAMKG